MKNNFIYLSSCCLLLMLIQFSACINEEGCTDPTAINYNPDAQENDGSCQFEIALPMDYSFTRSGTSSVSYNEAVYHHTLILGLSSYIKALATTDNELSASAVLADIDNFYTNTNTTGSISVDCSTYNIEPNTYESLYNNGVSLSSLLNNNTSLGENLMAAFDTIAQRSSLYAGNVAAYTTSNQIDLAAYIQKSLQAGVAYSTSIRFLLNMAQYDNTNVNGNQNYTTREQAWDLAYRYFGAIPKYQALATTAIADSPCIDIAPTDDTIELNHEYVFGSAQSAAARDAAISNTINNNFSHFADSLFYHFKAGRVAIVGKLESTQQQHALQIVQIWDALYAANLVHYINNILATLPNLGFVSTDAYYNQQWAMAYANLQAMPLNPQSTLVYNNTEVYTSILTSFGNQPVYGAGGTTPNLIYMASLQSIKLHLAAVYGFSMQQLEAW